MALQVLYMEFCGGRSQDENVKPARPVIGMFQSPEAAKRCLLDFFETLRFSDSPNAYKRLHCSYRLI
ncbi:MAG: hypothetical protein IPK82_17640 [Polyangiaceae bacterium]|nr:hypothetical protein [Polyangiaceae bacterium]